MGVGTKGEGTNTPPPYSVDLSQTGVHSELQSAVIELLQTREANPTKRKMLTFLANHPPHSNPEWVVQRMEEYTGWVDALGAPINPPK